jgi:hypothetical protein
MDRSSSPSPRGGGALLAAGILLGLIVGAWLGEATLGVLAGTGLGLAALLILWIADHRR